MNALFVMGIISIVSSLKRLKMNYKEYLESEEWKELRAKAYQKANHNCELCSDYAGACHHIKYPKEWSEDCLDNLLIVCARCHSLIEGYKINKEEIMRICLKNGLLVDKFMLEHIKTLSQIKILMNYKNNSYRRIITEKQYHLIK